MEERNDDIEEIWIAEGMYTPLKRGIEGNIRNKSQHFRMINGVTIYGGFPKAGNPTLADRNPETYKTILSGDLDRNDDDTEGSKTENVFNVFYHSEELALNETAILDGVTITGGDYEG